MPHSLCNGDMKVGRHGAWVFGGGMLGIQRRQEFWWVGGEEVPWQLNPGQHYKLIIHNWDVNIWRLPIYYDVHYGNVGDQGVF